MKRLRRTDILVIGGGAAGISAAIAAKTTDPKKEVTLVGEEPFPYRRPSIFSLIEGESLEDLAIFGPNCLAEYGIKSLFGAKIKALDLEDRLARFEDGKRISFEKAVIATGGEPFVPPVEGSSMNGVFSLRSYSDALRIREMAHAGARCFIVGAGLIGVKLASILHKREVKVTLVELKKVLWTLLEEPLSEFVRDLLISNGISVVEGQGIESIMGQEHVSSVKLSGKRYNADFVVFVTGVRPRVEVIADQLKFGVRGAIETDQMMRTSVEGVYACGDCSETIDLISGMKTYRPIGSIAYRAGIIAGGNLGGEERSYGGFLRLQGDEFLGTSVTSVGLTGAEARALGISFKALILKQAQSLKIGICSGLFEPDAKFLGILDGKERLIGFQAVGHKLSRKAIHSISSLISSKSKLEELRSIGLEPT